MRTMNAPTSDLPRVYLCGPIAGPGETPRGGYQVCNRRSIEALRSAGIDVRPLYYPHPHAGGWRKVLGYVAGFVRLHVQVLGCERGSILHITTLGGRFIYSEWPLMQLARLRGMKLVYDRRAGASHLHYAARGPWYRWLFRSSLEMSDELMVEGEAMMPFIERLSRRRAHYLPNHIDTDALPARDSAAEALPDAPTLVFVGRVVPEKGIDVLLEAARTLQEGGMGVQVCVAGDGDADYLKLLRLASAGLNVQWLGPLQSEAVLALMRSAHFLVFPTRHVGEGHSNALTEAMACGCVPVASRHGFNEAVIAEAGLTLREEARACDYAAAVASVWPARWPELSERTQRRARERYSTRAALGTLLDVYRRAVMRFERKASTLPLPPR